MESVQVRVRTNLGPSLALGDRSRAAAQHPPSTGSECFLSQLHIVFLMLLCFLERHTILAFAEYRVFFFCIFGMGILFAAQFWGLRGVRYGILDEKEAAVCLGFSFWLHQGEYHIALVDFIGSSRGRLERDRGFSIPYPSPTPLLTPEVSAAAGHICCRGGQGYRIPVSGADCLPPLRRGVWVLCVRAWTVRVSENHAGHMSFVFHYW